MVCCGVALEESGTGADQSLVLVVRYAEGVGMETWVDGGEKVFESRRGGVLGISRGDCEGAETGNKSARRGWELELGNGSIKRIKGKEEGNPGRRHSAKA